MKIRNVGTANTEDLGVDFPQRKSGKRWSKQRRDGTIRAPGEPREPPGEPWGTGGERWVF